MSRTIFCSKIFSRLIIVDVIIEEKENIFGGSSYTKGNTPSYICGKEFEK